MLSRIILSLVKQKDYYWRLFNMTELSKRHTTTVNRVLFTIDKGIRNLDSPEL